MRVNYNCSQNKLECILKTVDIKQPASAVSYARNMFVESTTGVYLIKLFGVNLQSSFCELTHFINVNYIFLGCEKIELSKRVSKLHQKSFVRLTTGVSFIKLFFWQKLQSQGIT
jgi:hypothetical protein